VASSKIEYPLGKEGDVGSWSLERLIDASHEATARYHSEVGNSDTLTTVS
jgi:hypothetical protein